MEGQANVRKRGADSRRPCCIFDGAVVTSTSKVQCHEQSGIRMGRSGCVNGELVENLSQASKKSEH